MREVKVKNLNFELKQVSDAGEFEGLAAVYEIKDDTDDIVHRGAFTRSIDRHKGKFPMFWQHRLDEPMGFLDVRDGESALAVKGRLNLEVGRARETHALMKQALAEGVPFGLSFGYDSIPSKTTWVGGVRHLKEVILYEISPTLMPAQQLATISSVKQREGKPFGEFEDFAACVAANQDKDDPEGFCAWLEHQITGEWPTEGAAMHFDSMEECVQANQDQNDPEGFCAAMMAQAEGQAKMKSRIAAVFAKTPQIRLSRDQVAKLCPACAEKMAARRMTGLVLSPKAIKQMPEELLQGLCETYGGAEGFFTRCQENPPSEIDDPEAFCAWLHEQCHGTFPAEGASLPIKAARHLLGEAASILEARGAAEIAARAREVKALLETDPAISPSVPDPAAEMALWLLLRQMRDDTRRRLTA